MKQVANKTVGSTLNALALARNTSINVARCLFRSGETTLGSSIKTISTTKETKLLPLPNFSSNISTRCFNTKPKDVKRDANDLLWNSVANADLDGIQRAVLSGADVNGFFILNDERTAVLHWAVRHVCRTGNTSILGFLFENKANVNLPVEDGWTPLHEAVDEGGIEVVKFLISNKANIDIRNGDGETALHMATIRNNEKMVELLLTYRPNVEIKDVEGRTPLHLAADEGRTEIAAMLLEYGANPHVLDNNGLTPAQLAAAEGQHNVARQIRRHVIKLQIATIKNQLNELERIVREDEISDTELRYVKNPINQ